MKEDIKIELVMSAEPTGQNHLQYKCYTKAMEEMLLTPEDINWIFFKTKIPMEIDLLLRKTFLEKHDMFRHKGNEWYAITYKVKVLKFREEFNEICKTATVQQLSEALETLKGLEYEFKQRHGNKIA